ncbi:hypothetical protein CFC21_047722 [Triticum aestivum]|nr:uncharacterized protein LOC109767013 isoform X1 [Aegilops tauschii subsp. strangulata]XP_040260045.1 uncharacterized protein LOC109767013 isoform X1 [Aegilops tauschii subsp. strangulata]XP_040260046.1 uncharacterized protein LOC109767013 isoform X1 [Aegilops tauschii subsp. strangulata]XP_044357473.1 uncharacterized protein LOC123078892 isoform X1 [Triticum aestivum]XP_044357474.1 uncharacterized protein LOC123078892 isoform X1 [Triticum aestivum]XP_044357475.1 uncharacterized protein LOC1
MAFASWLVAPPPAARAGWRPARAAPRRLVLAASSRGGGPAPAPPTFDRLREQLLQLHAEADLTQSKANSARVRLMRLTEAAENLKKRAVVSVRMGRENEAVELLVQKKKLTNALENIKERIELLDKLSAKISEVISVKQNMLIEHALRPGMATVEDSNDHIRVFSGKIDDRVDETSDSNVAGQSKGSELQMADSFTFSKDHDPTNIMDDHSAYDDFVQHIDSQLSSLQCEIDHYASSQLAKELDTQQSVNDKLHKLSTILKLITETRERIANISDNTVSESGSDGLR